MVFGLTSNAPLPDVDDETLLACYHYLAKNMRFPFELEHFTLRASVRIVCSVVSHI